MQENLCKLLYSILLIAQHHYITVTEFFNESLPTCTEQLLNGCVFDSPGMWPTLSEVRTHSVVSTLLLSSILVVLTVFPYLTIRKMKELDVQGFCAEPKTTTLTLSLKETRILSTWTTIQKTKKKAILWLDESGPADRKTAPAEYINKVTVT